MKKIFLTTVAFLFIVIISHSQTGKDNGYISFSIGPSQPVGKFGSTSLNNSSAGFAKTGGFVNFSYSKLLGKKFGIAVNLSGQLNPTNKKAMEDEFAKARISQGAVFGSTGNLPAPQLSTATYPNWNFKKGSWSAASLLVGGYGEFSCKNNLSFIAKVMTGVVYASCPKLSGSSYTDTATAQMQQTKASAAGLAYSVSAGIKQKMTQKVSLLVSLEYFNTATIKFKDIRSTITTTKGAIGLSGYMVQQFSATGTLEQKISSLNLHIGIGISL